MESSFVRVSDEIGQALADGRPVVGLETTLITHGLPQTEGIDVAAESGAKAVLDLPRTLEMLESLGVPVLGFRTDRFPAFYRRDSGLSVDARAERVEDLAAAVRAHLDLARAGGVLVVNPIPAEFEMSEDLYARSLDRAVEDAEKAGVRGRAVTPFLLERMRQLSEGASVFSNRALLVTNARLAGELAMAIAAKKSA